MQVKQFTLSKLGHYLCNQGNQLIMLFFHMDRNYIDAEPLRDHSNNSMIKAYQALWTCTMNKQQEKPKLHILDNEASTALRLKSKRIAIF